MKIITASTLGTALLVFIAFLFLRTSDASAGPDSQITQPTPSSTKEITSPTPTPSEIRQLGKQTPQVDELTNEQALNDILGTDDFDCDGIKNIKDNCPLVYNPGQKDSDRDRTGDACDADLTDPKKVDSRCDFDRDRVYDRNDNCPLACNPDQKDRNKNSVGDACDRAFANAVLNLQACANPKKIKAPKPTKEIASPTPPYKKQTTVDELTAEDALDFALGGDDFVMGRRIGLIIAQLRTIQTKKMLTAME